MVPEIIALLMEIAGVALLWILVFFAFDEGILDGILSRRIQKFVRDKLEKEG